MREADSLIRAPNQPTRRPQCEDAAVVVAEIVVAREGPSRLGAITEGRIDLELRLRLTD